MISSGKIRLTDSWSSAVSKSKYWYLIPLDMIETEQSFYFDRREPYLVSTKLPIAILGSIWVTLLPLYLWFTIWHKTPQSFILVILVALGSSLVPVINKKINQGLTNIVIIKKSWVSNDFSENETRVLKGKVPSGESYSLVYYLNPEQKKRLSFSEKYLGGAVFGGSPLPVEFIFTLKQA